MELGPFLTEVRTGSGGMTVESLSDRLRLPAREVRAMLDALRAAGMLGPTGDQSAGTDECSTSGACGKSCRGPSECPFVVDVGTTLELRPGVRRPATVPIADGRSRR